MRRMPQRIPPLSRPPELSAKTLNFQTQENQVTGHGLCPTTPPTRLQTLPPRPRPVPVLANAGRKLARTNKRRVPPFLRLERAARKISKQGWPMDKTQNHQNQSQSKRQENRTSKNKNSSDNREKIYCQSHDVRAKAQGHHRRFSDESIQTNSIRPHAIRLDSSKARADSPHRAPNKRRTRIRFTPRLASGLNISIYRAFHLNVGGLIKRHG